MLSFQRQPLRVLLRASCNASPFGNVVNRLPATLRLTAIKTFGALPFASMIKTLQCSKLGKHLLVRLNDLSTT
jgi:hypothetical protein